MLYADFVNKRKCLNFFLLAPIKAFKVSNITSIIENDSVETGSQNELRADS